MNTGTVYSTVLRKKLLQFNGGLFADDTVLPVNREQLILLQLARISMIDASSLMKPKMTEAKIIPEIIRKFPQPGLRAYLIGLLKSQYFPARNSLGKGPETDLICDKRVCNYVSPGAQFRRKKKRKTNET